MGGDYEDKVETKTKKQATVESPDDEGEDVTIVKQVRFHLSRGHVHFHDEKSGLKCYVPKAVWWGAWDKLRMPARTKSSKPVEWEYTDVDNETSLTVTSINKAGIVEITIDVSKASQPPVAYDRTWHALESFTNKTANS